MRNGWRAALAALLLGWALFPSFALAQGTDVPLPDPPPNGFVLDTLHWFKPEQVTQLNASIDDLEAKTKAEIAVVTLNDCGADPANYRNELFRKWGIGDKE
jgi:uncharacterized membrane protein YgcG